MTNTRDQQLTDLRRERDEAARRGEHGTALIINDKILWLKEHGAVTDRTADCDCCGQRRELSRCWYGNLETFACATCRGADDDRDAPSSSPSVPVAYSVRRQPEAHGESGPGVTDPQRTCRPAVPSEDWLELARTERDRKYWEYYRAMMRI